MKIVTVVGARPQFIKASTISRAIVHHQKSGGCELEEVILHTGQHYDDNMSDIFFQEMHIPKPKYNLGVKATLHGDMTAQQLQKIEKILLSEKPDVTLIYGDTNSTLAGALASVKLGIPVAHVESGLRSYNMSMPEEVNRIVADSVSDILFCPTDSAVFNLEQEGALKKGKKIINVGDVMLDAALYYTKYSKRPSGVNIDSDYILMTLHRQENTDSPEIMRKIIDGINKLSSKYPIIIPVHPRTEKKMVEGDLHFGHNVIVLDPVSYFEMLWLISHSRIVVTDSGGLQKESYFFKKPCITLREETEWTELVSVGANELCPPKNSDITNIIEKCFHEAIDSLAFSDHSLYGSGMSSNSIVEVLIENYS